MEGSSYEIFAYGMHRPLYFFRWCWTVSAYAVGMQMTVPPRIPGPDLLRTGISNSSYLDYLGKSFGHFSPINSGAGLCNWSGSTSRH